MLDSEVVELSENFAKFNDFAGGIDTIDGRTFDLISEALQLESITFTDFECIQIIENIIKQYHQWHKIEWERKWANERANGRISIR